MKHQLDDFIKGKLENREFEFNDSYWTGAQALIEADEQKKKRKKILFYITSAAVVAMIAAFSYYLGTQKNVSTPIEDIATIESTISDHNQTTSQKQSTSNYYSQTDDTQTQTQTIITDSNSTSQENQDFETPDKIVEVGEAIPQIVTDNNMKVTRITSPIAKSDSYKDDEAVSNTSSTYTNSNSKSIGKDSPNLNVSNQAMASQKPRVREDFLNLQKLSFASMMPLEYGSSEFSVDGLLQTSDLENDLSSSYNSVPKFYMGLKAGALLYIPAQKVGYNAGINFGYRFNRNLSLDAELFYAVLRNKYNVVDETAITTYSFGREDSEFSIRPEEIHSIELPLLLNFAFGSSAGKDYTTANRFLRHNVNFGASVAFVNGIKGNLAQTGNNNEVATPESGWLNSDYYNKLNYNLLLGYDLALTKALKIGVRAKYQLNDLYNNEVIQLQSAEPDHLYFELQTKFSIF